MQERSRPRPPLLQSGSSEKLEAATFGRQVSREVTPVALNSFGLLKPPESHPSTPLSICKPELARPLALGEDKVDEDMLELSWSLWFKRLLAFTGPGWLMSIAYVDPGNLEADLQIGAQFGYSLLWALFGSTAVGLGMQLVAARLGCATKRHLAEHCRDAFDQPLRLCLWALTEMAIIGSDIQEVIGCSIGLELLVGLSLAEGVLVTAFAAFIFLFLERLGTRPLELFFGVLILILALSMGRLFLVISPDDLAVLEGLTIPRLPPNALPQVVGMVGCVIMPHNLFLHSALVQSRVIQGGEEEEAIRLFTVESTAAILTSLEALLQPLSKRSMAAQTFSMHQAVLALETLLQSKVFPTMPKKGCFTTKRLNFKGDALGISIRPGLPKARETMECVHKYILSLGESKAMSHAIEFPSSAPLVPPPTFTESAPDIRYKAYQRMQTLRRRARKG